MNSKPAMTVILFLVLFYNACGQQGSAQPPPSKPDTDLNVRNNATAKKFLSTLYFLDASISSLNSFNSLLKKEAYRIKITSFNNPTSSDLGFNLEQEIKTALKPLLDKARITNTQKFSSIVSSVLGSSAKGTISRSLSVASPVFPTLLSLVGSLTLQEKKITREDLDSFITATQKYFIQYEKLNAANNLLDQNVDRLNGLMRNIQFDAKEYLLDVIVIFDKDVQRNTLKSFTNEELFLKFLDRYKLEAPWLWEAASGTPLQYPSDGIKGAKDLAYNLQKLFNDYQKVYSENYTQIKAILHESRNLGKGINVQQINTSLREVELLYGESKTSDILSLRLTTLFERLKSLTATEQQWQW